MSEVRKNAVECGYENTLFLPEEFDHCLLGVTSDEVAVYSADDVIEQLCTDMEPEDAMDHFSYNIEGSYVGEYTPIFVYKGGLV